jgi:hypothetical protein
MLSTAPPLWHPGRMFVHPAFDFLLIGGGLSLAVGVLAYAGGLAFTREHVPMILLFGNFAHFASSTVRLYAQPDAVRRWPFLTVWFPLLALMVFTWVLAYADWMVRYLFALFMIWSPFHYSAQAYGLSVMYSYRSGVRLEAFDKQLVRWACLVPFVWALLRPQGGLGLTLRHLGLNDFPVLDALRAGVSDVLSAVALAAPLLVFAWLRSRRGITLPVISVTIVAINAVWWTLFNYINAFFWAALFHGVQYLAIATIFHVKERAPAAGGGRGAVYHGAGFYGASVALAWILFVAWPDAYAWAGFDGTLTAQLTVAVINIHHFVVDAYIWKLRQAPNYRVVVGTAQPSG